RSFRRTVRRSLTRSLLGIGCSAALPMPTTNSAFSSAEHFILVQRFSARETLEANSRSRAAGQGGSRGQTGRNDLDAATGDPQSKPDSRARPPRDCGPSADNSRSVPLPVHGLSLSVLGRRRGLFVDAPICAD